MRYKCCNSASCDMKVFVMTIVQCTCVQGGREMDEEEGTEEEGPPLDGVLYVIYYCMQFTSHHAVCVCVCVCRSG